MEVLIGAKPDETRALQVNSLAQLNVIELDAAITPVASPPAPDAEGIKAGSRCVIRGTRMTTG